MAERRMFSQKIVDSDAFLDMPLSSQALYFHLNMRADDDGFVNNPKRIQRTIGASEDDLKLLLAKRFILAFENGVVCIKHWRMHNTLRKDRYSPTQYQEQLATLAVKDNNAYTEKPGNHLATTWQPTGNHLATQYSIGESSIVKSSVGEREGKADQENEIDPLPLGEYQNVILSFQELESLKAEFVDWKAKIENLSSYMKRTGKTYDSHYATIRKWAKDDAQKQGQNTRRSTPTREEADRMQRYLQKMESSNPPKTAGNDEELRKRAEAIKVKCGG